MDRHDGTTSFSLAPDSVTCDLVAYSDAFLVFLFLWLPFPVLSFLA